MNIGLVLSGGMAKGAYQIGALKALEKFIPIHEIKCISCSSVGILNGFAFATGRMQEAEHMWRHVCSDDSRMLFTKIVRSNMLQQNIQQLCDAADPLPMHFYCSLMDLGSGNIVYKDLREVDREQIPLYLKAGVAIPAYNRAVCIDGKSYYDGAFIDNIPLYPLIRHSLDFIIVIHFDDTYYKFENAQIDSKVIQLSVPSKNLLRELVTFSNANVDAMIEEGYKETLPILRMIFSNGYEDLETVNQNIICLNKQHRDRSLRLTAGIIATNVNKITQMLTNRKIL